MAHADLKKLKDTKELESVNFLSEEEFAEETKAVKFMPNDDVDLAYTMNIPSDWSNNTAIANIVVDDETITEKVLGTVVRHIGPPHPEYERSFLLVDVTKLDYEISLKDWFVNYTTLNGLSLEQLTVKDERELDAVYVEVKKDTTFIVRVKALLNGSKMIVVKYYVSQDLFEKEKVMQAQVVDSFKLSAINTSSIEKLETFSFLGQSFFSHPLTWTFKPPVINSIDFMRVKLYRNVLWRKLKGQIELELTNKLSAKSRAEVIKKYVDEFQVKGYKLGNLIESPKIKYHKDISIASTQVYDLDPVSSNMIDYELWVSIMEGEDYYYLSTLITPARENEFYEWARNTATYKLVVKNVRRYDEGEKYQKYFN